MREGPLTKLCRRHSFRLFLDAFGTLLDLTGKHYGKRANQTLALARKCPDCRRRSAER